MRLNTKDSVFFRAGVGAIIVAPNGRVLACQRRDKRSWQLPQGGLDPKDKDEVTAILREIKEETGIKSKQLTLLGVHPYYLSYRLPEATKKHGIGQTHRWFAFRYEGGAMPALPKKGEFKARAWAPFTAIEHAVNDIKKPTYTHLKEWLASLGAGVQV
jgi:8-oxo-dGTP pyrophosphatase MutT (NUDIX family)